MQIWSISRRELIEAGLVVLLVALALVPALVWITSGVLSEGLLTEGGLFETGSALASLIAAGVFARTAFLSHSRWQTFWLACLAFGCFVLAGEEVSWGQHLFGFEPPAVIAENNFQGEFNLHNLSTFQSHNNAISSWLFRALMAYLILLPLAVHAFPSLTRLTRSLAFPVPSASIALAALLIKAADMLNHEVIYGISFATDTLRVGEMVESLYQVCILWLALSQAREVRSSAASLNPASGLSPP